MELVKIATNFNQKLNCDFFIHISMAPPQPVPESKLGQMYQIEIKDLSHPGVEAELLFFYRFHLGSAVDIYTMPSHGMDAADFIQWFLKEYPDADYNTELAVYFYKKAPITTPHFVH